MDTNGSAKLCLSMETIELTSKCPMILWTSWYLDARSNPANDRPETMSLATVKSDGCPAARTVLLGGYNDEGFKMFWDYRSPKTEQIESNNQRAALVFRWSYKSPSGKIGSRQVRVEGTMERLSRDRSLLYFKMEPVLVQIRCVNSNQSVRVKPGRRDEILKEGQKLLNETCTNPNYRIEMPSTWGGYFLKPNMMEFYQGTRNSFNDRVRFFKRSGNGVLPIGVYPGEEDWVYEQLEC